jgi:hypothetical protein
MNKTIKFDGYYVDCEFDGELWFNSAPYLDYANPVKMSEQEYQDWESRLLDSDEWDNLYEALEAAE